MNGTPEIAPGLEDRAAERIAEEAQQQVENALACLETRLDLEGSARYCGALVRRRVIASAGHLLKLLLVYALVPDCSLSMVGIWATVQEWGSLNKNAVRKRLRNSQAWLGRLIVLLLMAGRLALPQAGRVRLRLIDASLICQPGRKKASWRLHLSFDLAAGRLDGVQLTSLQAGESLTRWQFAADEVVLADRYYGVRNSLGVLLGACAQFVIRIGWQNLPVEDAQGQPFSIPTWLAVQSADPAAAPAQTQVWVVTPQGRYPIRLIARAIPPEKAAHKRSQLQAEAKRQHRQLDPRSLLAAGFVVVVSNLPETHWSAGQILDLYRFRWQVELVFRRLKGLLAFDQLRVTRDPALAQVFLLTKLLVALALGEMQWRLALASPQSFADPDRPLSLWRLTQLTLEVFRQTMIGSLTQEALQAHWPLLQRYLCDAPRHRRSQFAHRPL